MKRMNHKWDNNQIEWKKTEYISENTCCIRKLRKDKGKRIDDIGKVKSHKCCEIIGIQGDIRLLQNYEWKNYSERVIEAFCIIKAVEPGIAKLSKTWIDFWQQLCVVCDVWDVVIKNFEPAQ